MYLSQNKQQLFPYTAFTVVFITETEIVYCAVRTEYLSTKKWLDAAFCFITTSLIFDVQVTVHRDEFLQ